MTKKVKKEEKIIPVSIKGKQTKRESSSSLSSPDKKKKRSLSEQLDIELGNHKYVSNNKSPKRADTILSTEQLLGLDLDRMTPTAIHRHSQGHTHFSSTTRNNITMSNGHSHSLSLSHLHNVNPNTDNPTPFHYKKSQFLVSLLPSSLHNIKKALYKSMHSLLLKYSDGVHGVILSFDNIQIDASHSDAHHAVGRILNEMPHIHYYITSNVLVFVPTLGMTLKGVVNESFPSHVGLLTLNYFNAMVDAEMLRECGYNYDYDSKEWKKKDKTNYDDDDGGVEDSSKYDDDGILRVGDELFFDIEKVHECNGLISLEGSNPSPVF